MECHQLNSASKIRRESILKYKRDMTSYKLMRILKKKGKTIQEIITESAEETIGKQQITNKNHWFDR